MNSYRPGPHDCWNISNPTQEAHPIADAQAVSQFLKHRAKRAISCEFEMPVRPLLKNDAPGAEKRRMVLDSVQPRNHANPNICRQFGLRFIPKLVYIDRIVHKMGAKMSEAAFPKV